MLFVLLQLHALGVPAGHFTHVMMDEAGHAEEPLALCAIAGHIGEWGSMQLNQCTLKGSILHLPQDALFSQTHLSVPCMAWIPTPSGKAVTSNRVEVTFALPIPLCRL